MATNTPNLNLLKKDPIADGNETFNIQTMLNDNWDKIDAAIGDVREELQDIDIPPASLTEAGIVRLSNSTSGTRENVAATEMAVKTAYDVAAAAETKAEQAFQFGNERKQEIVDALIALGISASTTESWNSLISKLAVIIKATGNATSADVLTGRTFSNDNGNNMTGTMPNRGAVTSTITTQNGEYTIPAGYHNGSGKVTASFANLVAGNVKYGVNIGGVTGSLKDASNIMIVEHAPSITQSDVEYNRVIDFSVGYTPIAWSGAAVYLQYPSGSQYYTSYDMRSAKNLTPELYCRGTNRDIYITGTINWTGSGYRATYRVSGINGRVDLSNGSCIVRIYWACAV
ncbi:phage tail protein [Paenibacillus phoenicis]|uniref:Phage tail protein n=1 Tax=Paenibacillus phoenicis TaxID=554117 RepID=A0ABU5PKM5_9BACL|nr:phage tail protein [Paenibacillus phoenicis]MEA3570463.1 phage tail protein [Paenibacillus phoenicis]